MSQGHQPNGDYIKLDRHWHILDGETVLMHSDDEKLIRQKFAFFKYSALPGENIILEPPKRKSQTIRRNKNVWVEWASGIEEWERSFCITEPETVEDAPININDLKVDDD